MYLGLSYAYGRASRQCINFFKYVVMFSPNVHEARQSYLQSLLGVVLPSPGEKEVVGIFLKTKYGK